MPTAGPLSPQQVISSGTGNAWSNVTAVGASDDAYATSIARQPSTPTGSPSSQTAELIATRFGFNLPTNAIVKGILFEIERKATSAVANIGADLVIKLVGVTSATNNKAAWVWSSLESILYYGGNGDLWGGNSSNVTYNLINSTNFGIKIQAWNNYTNAPSTYNVNFFVDHIRCTVYYDLAIPTITSFTATAVSTTPDRATRVDLSATATNTSKYHWEYKLSSQPAGAWVEFAVTTTGSTYKDQLLSGTSYDFRVRGEYSDGVTLGPYSTVTVTTLKPTISSLVANAISSRRIDLSTISSDTQSFYWQYKKTSDINFIPFAITTTGTVSLTGLVGNTSYDIRVRGETPTGSGLFGDWKQVTAQTLGAPQAPTITGLLPLDYQSIKVVASNTADTDFWHFEYKLSTDLNWIEFAVVPTYEATVSGLSTNKKYDFRVRGENTGGLSGYSQVASAYSKYRCGGTTDAGAKILVFDLLDALAATSDLLPQGSATADSAGSFTIEVSGDGRDRLVVVLDPAGVPSRHGRLYPRDGGIKSWGIGSSYRPGHRTGRLYTVEPEGIPFTPEGLEAKEVGSSSVVFVWRDVSSVTESIELKIEKQNDPSSAQIYSLAAGTEMFQVTQLSPAIGYRAMIRAVNSVGASAWSEELLFYTVTSLDLDAGVEVQSRDVFEGMGILELFSGVNIQEHFASGILSLVKIQVLGLESGARFRGNWANLERVQEIPLGDGHGIPVGADEMIQIIDEGRLA
jgi:hypothetical protein